MSGNDIDSGEAGSDDVQHSGDLELPVEDVHGVGEKYGARLRTVGVETLAELADKTPSWVASATERYSDGTITEGVASNIIHDAQFRAMMSGAKPDQEWDVKQWAEEATKTRVAVVWPKHYDDRPTEDVLGKFARAVMESPWEPEVVHLMKPWGAAASIRQWVQKEAMRGEPVASVPFQARWNDIPRDAKMTELGVQTEHEEWVYRGKRRDFTHICELLEGVPSMTLADAEEKHGTWGSFLDAYDVEVDEEYADDIGLYYRMAAKRRDQELLDKADGVIIMDADSKTEYTASTAKRMNVEVFDFRDGRRGREVTGEERTANADEGFDATEDRDQETVDWTQFNDYDDDLDDGPGGDGDPTDGKQDYTSGQ